MPTTISIPDGVSDTVSRLKQVQIPTIPTNISIPDSISDAASRLNQYDGISSPDIGLSRGNLLPLICAIGGIIAIMLLASAIMGGGSSDVSAESGSQGFADVRAGEVVQKASGVTVIYPPGYCKEDEQSGWETTCAPSGYDWKGKEILIASPGEYKFANVNFPDKPVISVRIDEYPETTEEVTIDGSGVTIDHIESYDGKRLNLKNVRIEPSSTYYPGIMECNNIVDSSIFMQNGGTGIGTLYGNMERTKIVVESSNGEVIGVKTLYGTISSGEISATAQGDLFSDGSAAVWSLYGTGTISGGEFTTISKNHYAYGVRHMYDSETAITGGKFTVTGNRMVYGVLDVSGTISGGEFIVNGKSDKSSEEALLTLYLGPLGAKEQISTDDGIYGVGTLKKTGIISGGKFTITGENAGGVYNNGGTISGGELTVNGKKIS